MKAQELRCGNIVRIKQHFYEGAITYIDAENGVIKTDVPEFYTLLHLEDIEPIELTPEVLGKAGFEISTKDQLERHGSCHYKIVFDNGKTFYLWYGIEGNKYMLNWSEFTIYIENLHQLQNLYFDITGTELQITL